MKPTPIEYSKFDKLGLVGLDAEYNFEKISGGATSRVMDFRSGVWKRFLIDARDDEYWTVALKRNFSYNTILSAIALDPIADLGGAEGPHRQPPRPHSARYKFDVDAFPKTTQGASLLLADKLLFLRDANPTWYFQNSRTFILPLLRTFSRPDKSGNNLAARIEQSEKAPQVRQNIAQLFNDAQLFDKRDQTFYSADHYLSYAYEGKTKAGEKWEGWQWNDKEYDQFIAAHQQKQSW